MNEMESDNILNCSIPGCHAGFTQLSSLTRHLASHRPEFYSEKAEKGEKLFECKYCDAKFTKSHRLKTHEKTHFEEAPEKAHQCVICNTSFQSEWSLKRHIRLRKYTLVDLHLIN